MATDCMHPSSPSSAAALLTQELLTGSQFAAILIVSKRTLFRLRARGGDFPPPVELATNTIRWRAADVRAYIDTLKIRKPRRHEGK